MEIQIDRTCKPLKLITFYLVVLVFLGGCHNLGDRDGAPSTESAVISGNETSLCGGVTQGSAIQRLCFEFKQLNHSRMEEAKLLNAWIFATISEPEIGDTISDAEAALQIGRGTCGHRDLIIHDFYQGSPVKYRRVNFWGVPWMVGHVATELFIDNEWRFFDSTTGIYFALPSDPSTPISLQKARENFPMVTVQRVQLDGWGKAKYSVISLQEIQNQNQLYGALSNSQLKNEKSQQVLGTVDQIYILSKASPAPEKHEFSWSYVIDLAQSGNGQFGEVNGSDVDLIGILDEMYGYVPLMNRLGRSPELGTIRHDYHIQSSQKRKIKFRMSFVGDYPAVHANDFLVGVSPLSAKYLRSNEYASEIPAKSLSDKTLIVEFTVYPPSTILTIKLSGQLSQMHTIDNISWTSL